MQRLKLVSRKLETKQTTAKILLIASLFAFIQNKISNYECSASMSLPGGIDNILGFEPKSSFVCERDGYFGDVENDCRLFHLCQKQILPNGRTQWHHWTYACGNQTMFNQLTLTCAFVDEAIPCKHATRFQYLNEVIHRPKEPFLTDADVTSGVSYYGNALLAEGARNRAFEDQNLMAQLGAASLLESLSFVQSQPSQLNQLAYSFQQPQRNNQNNNEQQSQQEFGGSFQADTQFVNLQSSSQTDNIDQQQQQQINAYAIDTNTGNNIEQKLNFSRILPQTQVEFSNEQAPPNSLQYQYQDQSQYQDQTINQQNILDTQVPLEVNREQQQQQQVNLRQPQEQLEFIYNNQNQQQAQVNNQQQNQQATGTDQLNSDREDGLTPVAAVSTLSGSSATSERENISAFTRASVSPDSSKPAANQLFDFSFVTSHADLVARQPTNQFVAGNDQQIVQGYTGYPSISQTSENSNQVQQQQEQIKVEDNGGNLRALNLTRVNKGSPISRFIESDKIDTTTTNLPNQSSQTSYSMSSLSTELTTESPSSFESSNTTITATTTTTPPTTTPTPISIQSTAGDSLIPTIQKTTEERINNSKRRSALRNLHRSTSFQSNRVSANQENSDREQQQSLQKPSSLSDKKQSASIVMRQMITGIEESRNKQQQVPRLSSRGKKRQTQVSDQFVQLTFGGDNIDIQAPKFESMVTKRRT